jgi:hypothetical protein
MRRLTTRSRLEAKRHHDMEDFNFDQLGLRPLLVGIARAKHLMWRQEALWQPFTELSSHEEKWHIADT